MIGNDVVDLQLAKTESNWQRKGFLNKIFTKNEQLIIKNSKNPEITIWNLWSRKEAAYKIWNRATGIRKYNPIQFECFDFNMDFGKIHFKNIIYYTKTEILNYSLHTIAVSKVEDFNKISILNNTFLIHKNKGLPYFLDTNIKQIPISKSHHGNFEKIVYLNNSEFCFQF